ncbi:hypothetical protein HGRIS_008361 [Hohenbuehelia grisea]
MSGTDTSLGMEIIAQDPFSAASYSRFHPYDSSIPGHSRGHSSFSKSRSTDILKNRLRRAASSSSIVLQNTQSRDVSAPELVPTLPIPVTCETNEKITADLFPENHLRSQYPQGLQRSLTKSPSLGYIPTAFPPIPARAASSLVPTQEIDLNTDTAKGRSQLRTDEDIASTNGPSAISQEFLADAVSQSFRDSDLYSELAQAQVPVPVALPHHTFFTGSALPESFASALASHYTFQSNASASYLPGSVLARHGTLSSQSQALRCLPTPIAYTLRLSELSAYHSRLRALDTSNLAIPGNANNPNSGPALRENASTDGFRSCTPEIVGDNPVLHSDGFETLISSAVHLEEPDQSPLRSPSRWRSSTSPPRFPRRSMGSDAHDIDTSNKENEDPNTLHPGNHTLP